jgi:hypothetical protein
MNSFDNILGKMKPLMGTQEPKERIELENLITELRKLDLTDEQRLIIKQFIQTGIDESKIEVESIKCEINLREQLKEVAEIISLSYIAKTYFKKSRVWLYQKIDGTVIHNKPCKFTEEEIETLKFALKDIANKLDSIQLVIK